MSTSPEPPSSQGPQDGEETPSDSEKQEVEAQNAESLGHRPVNLPSRHDLQLGRRLFHCTTGTTVATLYLLFLDHYQVVALLGLSASMLYLFEQVRIAYPGFANQLLWFNRFLLRAEERLKESSSVPYAMGILLTILTFPKVPSVIAIYTLAIADPLAAIIGIRFGGTFLDKSKYVSGRSLEGSLAFFLATLFCASFVFTSLTHGGTAAILGASVLVALLASACELIPVRIDDNLTIPLYTAGWCWVIAKLFALI